MSGGAGLALMVCRLLLSMTAAHFIYVKKEHYLKKVRFSGRSAFVQHGNAAFRSVLRDKMV